MSNNKQSSVEWLVDQICGDHTGAWEEQIKQAKAMHKEEIQSAFVNGYINTFDFVSNNASADEQYYNETYGGKK